MKIYKTFFTNIEGTMLENYFARREDAIAHLKKLGNLDATGQLPWVFDDGVYYATLTEIEVQ